MNIGKSIWDGNTWWYGFGAGNMSTWKQKMHPCVKEGETGGMNSRILGFINSCDCPLGLHICNLHVLCPALPLPSLLSNLSLCLHLCKSYPTPVLCLRPLRDTISPVVLFVCRQSREQVPSTMESKKQMGGSSSSMTLDHLFGPKDPSSASSSSTGIFSSIFPAPPAVPGRDSSHKQGGSRKYGNPDVITQSSKGERSGVSTGEKGSIYQSETMEPFSLSSSIYYGGRENYSPRNGSSESEYASKKDGADDDYNGSNPNSASRGNWWQGSLYY